MTRQFGHILATRPVQDVVKQKMAAIGRDAWTEEIVAAMRGEDRFYPSVYQALLKLQKNGEVVRVPHANTGARGPILWRLVAPELEEASGGES